MSGHKKWFWSVPALLALGALALAFRSDQKHPEAAPQTKTEPEAAKPRAPVPRPKVPVKVRRAVLAGGWYPGEPAALGRRLDVYLERAGAAKVSGRPVALVSPHAGYLYSGQAAAYGFKALKGQGIRRVVILGLSHSHPFHGASIPDATHYETPLGRIPIDLEAVEKLRRDPLFGNEPTVHKREHSIEMQLPFLQRVLDEGFTIVPIAFGNLDKGDYARAAKAIKPLLDDKTVVVASSDFLHYGKRFRYLPFNTEIPANIEALDRTAFAKILAKDFSGFYDFHRKSKATICGRVPVGVLLNLLPGSARGTLARYYRSGDLTGHWDGSVSYGSIIFVDGGAKDSPAASFAGSEAEARESEMLEPKAQKQILSLARAAVEAYVREKKTLDVEKLSIAESLKKSRGIFVTLRKNGRLRGCIGSIVGQTELYKGVVMNAISSCSRDHRFKPVKPEELKDITVEVSILSRLKRERDWRRILPGWHGVVLVKNGKQSVYLPYVALEQGWETEEMLTSLARKAGLSGDDWREGAEFHLFEAQIIPE